MPRIPPPRDPTSVTPVACHLQQELDGGAQVFEEIVGAGRAQSLFVEGATANGDARDTDGAGGDDIEGSIANVGRSLGRDVAEALETLEERSRVGFVLSSVLHSNEDVYNSLQAGEGVQRHLDGEAALRGGEGEGGVAQAREGGFDVGELPDQTLMMFVIVEVLGLQELFGSVGVQELHLAR
jgi:hypothetical protein